MTNGNRSALQDAIVTYFRGLGVDEWKSPAEICKALPFPDISPLDIDSQLAVLCTEGAAGAILKSQGKIQRRQYSLNQ